MLGHGGRIGPAGCDERGKAVDNPPGRNVVVTNLVDKSLDGVAPGRLSFVLPEGASNI